MSRRSMTVVSLLFALAATGCGTTEAHTPEELRTTWNSAFDTNLALQDDLIRLYRDCMEDQGFTQHPDETMGTHADRLDPFAVLDRYFEVELPTREYAEEHGMSASPMEWQDYLLSTGQPFTNSGEDALSEKDYGEYHEALWGYNPNLVVDESQIPNRVVIDVGDHEILYSTKGCRYEVQNVVLDGQVWQYHQWTYQAKNGISQSMSLDKQPEVASVVDDWSACMADAGYPDLTRVKEFLQVIWDEVWNPISANPPEIGSPEFVEAKKDEIALALVHVDCDEEAGLRDTYLATADRLVDEYFVEHETELFAWYEMLTDSRERASDLLASLAPDTGRDHGRFNGSHDDA